MKYYRTNQNPPVGGIRISTLEKDLRVLLGELCIEWGFCIPTYATNSIVASEEITSEEFTVAVLEAEGMDASPYSEWYEKIKKRFEGIFGETVTKSSYNKIKS